MSTYVKHFFDRSLDKTDISGYAFPRFKSSSGHGGVSDPPNDRNYPLYALLYHTVKESFTMSYGLKCKGDLTFTFLPKPEITNREKIEISFRNKVVPDYVKDVAVNESSPDTITGLTYRTSYTDKTRAVKFKFSANKIGEATYEIPVIMSINEGGSFVVKQYASLYVQIK